MGILESMLGGFLVVVLLLERSGAALLVPKLLGVNPQEREYYESNVIMCKDGSKTFSRDRLNDDFCDCGDGTDEPGTTACPEGRFYCLNSGNTPVQLFSSQVKDGICDCCDGTDEYYGKIRCPNTCRMSGKALAGKLTNSLSAYNNEVSSLENKGRERTKDKFFAEVDLLSLKQDKKELKGIIQKLKEFKVLLLFELVLVASLLVFSQRSCCRSRHLHSRRRQRS